jgi:arabinose-5-phosphate isomerase
MKLIDIAREVIDIEISGLKELSANLCTEFEQTVDKILVSNGRTIVCGMGKSGIIGKKISASLASTGTASFFMHPGEAFHGDLGMVEPEDVFIAISNSGETDEVLKLLPFLRDNKNVVIGITGNPNSTLAKHSHHHLNIAVSKEACHLQLAPTASTTAALVMGDALTVALMKKRDFKAEHFARFHPGGSLGKRLLGKVSDEMISEQLPIIRSDTLLPDVIHAISDGKLGIAIIIDNAKVNAIVTDGDLRRAIEKHGKEVFSLTAADICTHNPVSIIPTTRLQTAYEMMETQSVNCLLVQTENEFLGVIKK